MRAEPSGSQTDPLARYDFADSLAAAVENRDLGELRQVEAKVPQEDGERRAVASSGSVLCLERDTDSVRTRRAEEPFGPAFSEPARRGAHEGEVGAVRAADEVRTGAHGGDDPGAVRQRLESRVRVSHPVEPEGERDDAAAVARGNLRLDLGGLRVRLVTRALDRMLRQGVALPRRVASPAEGEHAGVLARAVVVDLLRRPPLLETELEIVLRRLGAREQAANRLDLLDRVVVRGAGDRELVIR